MPPKVHVKVSFVSSKRGVKPSVFIEDPIDLTRAIGEFDIGNFTGLKASLSNVVEDKDFDLFFHHDKNFKYTFEERALENGAIYGRKQKKSKDEEVGAKITAGRLIAIKSSSQFTKHVQDVAEVVLKRPESSRNVKKKKNQQTDHYVVELCVVIIKEKVKKVIPPPSITQRRPVASITTTLTESDEESENTPAISSEHPSKKRKINTPFTFKARSLSICLGAPIEQIHRKNTVETKIPSGKTTKDIVYDLEPFILGRCDDINSDSVDSIENSSSGDESFLTSFTLSKFRNHLMELALEKFPEEYDIKTKSLGTKCKLFFQKQWNNSSWSEIATTVDLHRNLKNQMTIKGRILQRRKYLMPISLSTVISASKCTVCQSSFILLLFRFKYALYSEK